MIYERLFYCQAAVHRHHSLHLPVSDERADLPPHAGAQCRVTYQEFIMYVLLIAAQQRLLSAQQVRGLQEGRQSGGCAHSHR